MSLLCLGKGLVARRRLKAREFLAEYVGDLKREDSEADDLPYMLTFRDGGKQFW